MWLDDSSATQDSVHANSNTSDKNDTDTDNHIKKIVDALMEPSDLTITSTSSSSSSGLPEPAAPDNTAPEQNKLFGSSSSSFPVPEQVVPITSHHFPRISTDESCTSGTDMSFVEEDWWPSVGFSSMITKPATTTTTSTTTTLASTDPLNQNPIKKKQRNMLLAHQQGTKHTTPLPSVPPQKQQQLQPQLQLQRQPQELAQDAESLRSSPQTRQEEPVVVIEKPQSQQADTAIAAAPPLAPRKASNTNSNGIATTTLSTPLQGMDAKRSSSTSSQNSTSNRSGCTHSQRTQPPVSIQQPEHEADKAIMTPSRTMAPPLSVQGSNISTSLATTTTTTTTTSSSSNFMNGMDAKRSSSMSSQSSSTSNRSTSGGKSQTRRTTSMSSASSHRTSHSSCNNSTSSSNTNGIPINRTNATTTTTTTTTLGRREDNALQTTQPLLSVVVPTPIIQSPVESPALQTSISTDPDAMMVPPATIRSPSPSKNNNHKNARGESSRRTKAATTSSTTPTSHTNSTTPPTMVPSPPPPPTPPTTKTVTTTPPTTTGTTPATPTTVTPEMFDMARLQLLAAAMMLVSQDQSAPLSSSSPTTTTTRTTRTTRSASPVPGTPVAASSIRASRETTASTSSSTHRRTLDRGAVSRSPSRTKPSIGTIQPTTSSMASSSSSSSVSKGTSTNTPGQGRHCRRRSKSPSPKQALSVAMIEPTSNTTTTAKTRRSSASVGPGSTPTTATTKTNTSTMTGRSRPRSPSPQGSRRRSSSNIRNSIINFNNNVAPMTASTRPRSPTRQPSSLGNTRSGESPLKYRASSRTRSTQTTSTVPSKHQSATTVRDDSPSGRGISPPYNQKQQKQQQQELQDLSSSSMDRKLMTTTTKSNKTRKPAFVRSHSEAQLGRVPSSSARASSPTNRPIQRGLVRSRTVKHLGNTPMLEDAEEALQQPQQQLRQQQTIRSEHQEPFSSSCPMSRPIQRGLVRSRTVKHLGNTPIFEDKEMVLQPPPPPQHQQPSATTGTRSSPQRKRLQRGITRSQTLKNLGTPSSSEEAHEPLKTSRLDQSPSLTAARATSPKPKRKLARSQTVKNLSSVGNEEDSTFFVSPAVAPRSNSPRKSCLKRSESESRLGNRGGTTKAQYLSQLPPPLFTTTVPTTHQGNRTQSNPRRTGYKETMGMLQDFTDESDSDCFILLDQRPLGKDSLSSSASISESERRVLQQERRQKRQEHMDRIKQNIRVKQNRLVHNKEEDKERFLMGKSQRLLLAYQWYLGHDRPTKSKMLQLVKTSQTLAAPRGIYVTQGDIDLLPWVYQGGLLKVDEPALMDVIKGEL